MLLEDHEQIICVLREMIDRCETQHGDRGTSDQLCGLLQEHEEAAWMLRSFIEGEAVRSDGQVKLPASASPSLA
jgi:starvation-inducible DNA-binding protein